MKISTKQKSIHKIIRKAKLDLLEKIASRADKINSNSIELDYGKTVLEIVCKYARSENKIEDGT